VNAPAVAGERGVTHEVVTETESPNHRSQVDVRAVFADGSIVNVAGTLTEPQQVQKIVNINGRNFDLRAEGRNLLVSYADQPGSLGKIGTVLGGASVDIEAAALAQDVDGEGATMILRLDRELDDALLASVGDAVSATLIKQVNLG
ncbi:MAG: phosphoglycerate dehydrogenase, partial [Gordonia sp. (in: high G+C Gram-positive bacteria)]